jgi:hypothetical protein
MKAYFSTHFLGFIFILIAVFAQAQEQGEVVKINPHRYRIAAIIPLSGEHEAMGKNMLGAMQLALLDLKAENFDIVPIDSELEENEMLLQIAANKLNAIVGPVFAKDVRKVMPVLESDNTCVMSFSNDRALSSNACLMLLGFMPEESINRVVGYASHHNYKINALLPDSKYGHIIASNLLNMSSHGKISLGEIAFYKPGNTKGKADPAIEDLFAKLNSATDKLDQAVLIPENSIMPQVMPHLATRKIKVLGSSQFEDERFLKSPEMQGSWFASAPRKYRDRFEKKFITNFDVAPLKISSLAYDAVAFSYDVISSTNGSFKRDYLTDPSGFYGITGAFRFMPDGSNQRKLSIFEINAGNFAEIEPAKPGFS